ncbi:Protein of unknown function DUF1647 family-containing protein [Aphelenchoides besseyi]|nr:Protein of unknown function DUF1647 family-containing protein [Aphelenchoides besseyi]
MLSRRMCLIGKICSFVSLLSISGYFFWKKKENDPSVELLTTTTEKLLNYDYCNCNGENFCFHGLDAEGKVTLGKQFDCSLYSGLQQFALTQEHVDNATNDYERLNPETWQPVFITSVSDDHFPEARRLFQSLNQFYPNSRIIMYDLGLSDKKINELITWCNVEYRKFDFSKYPQHVSQLLTYAFKLLILEVLQEHKTFFYLDSSARLTGRNLDTFLRAVKEGRLMPLSTHGFTTHIGSLTSPFTLLISEMYDYVPISFNLLQMTEIQSTMFLSDSSYTRKILKWFYLCAMTEECIAPKGSIRHCALNEYPTYYSNIYLNCHRFDQAFWNLYSLAFMFGEYRGAVKLNYTNPWIELNSTVIEEVERNRAASMNPISSLLDIRRKDGLRRRLKLECPKFQT